MKVQVQPHIDFDNQKKSCIGNHLGNVLTTISDRKIGVYSNGSLTLPNDTVVAVVDYYEPHMVNATDYYAFGMPSRVASSATGQEYRFGFNGKENDNEVKGFGNQQDYGMRIYDPRVGRFLSGDPLTKNYPWYTPYQFAGNNPIKFIDLDGAEPFDPQKHVQSDISPFASKYNKKGTLLKEKEPVPLGALNVAIGVLNTACVAVGALTEIPAAMEYGDKVDKEEAFPLTHGNLGYTVKMAILAPAELAIRLKKDPGNEQLWGEALVLLSGFVKIQPRAKGVAPDISLGVAEKLKDRETNQPLPNALVQFSNKHDAYAHYNWQDPFGSIASANKTGFEQIFKDVVNHVIQNGGRIKFNLDYFSLETAAKDYGKSILDADHYTGGEFYYEQQKCF